jgi:arylsulfatase
VTNPGETSGDHSLSRRSILLGGSALASSVMGAAAPAQLAQAQTPTRKPNILFMLVDNLGYGELGVYGGGATRGAPPPRIDRLASEGLRLTNMNMEAQCTPSRSAILTGRYALIAMGTPDPYVPPGGKP